jgi:hypothetical protein
MALKRAIIILFMLIRQLNTLLPQSVVGKTPENITRRANI